MGLWRKLPMKWHQILGLTSSAVTIVVPWVFFRHAGAFPWVASVLGVTIFIVTLLRRPVRE